MPNFKQILDNITEGANDIITKELFAKALKFMTRDEISKYSKKPAALEKLIQQKQEKKWREADKAAEKDEKAKAREHKKNLLSDKEFKKRCKEAGESWSDDNDTDQENGDDLHMTLSQVAYDMADSMLYDQDIKDYVKNKLGTEYNKQTAIEYIADEIVG